MQLPSCGGAWTEVLPQGFSSFRNLSKSNKGPTVFTLAPLLAGQKPRKGLLFVQGLEQRDKGPTLAPLSAGLRAEAARRTGLSSFSNSSKGDKGYAIYLAQ